jgi:hypothetical protein
MWYFDLQQVHAQNPGEGVSFQECFGDAVAWGGCTILYLLGQELRFELLDFTYHVLSVAESDTLPSSLSYIESRAKGISSYSLVCTTSSKFWLVLEHNRLKILSPAILYCDQTHLPSTGKAALTEQLLLYVPSGVVRVYSMFIVRCQCTAESADTSWRLSRVIGPGVVEGWFPWYLLLSRGMVCRKWQHFWTMQRRPGGSTVMFSPCCGLGHHTRTSLHPWSHKVAQLCIASSTPLHLLSI